MEFTELCEQVVKNLACTYIHNHSYTLHSNNLYQIFTYVKNHDRKNTGNVSGMLLYAKTQESITPDCVFPMGGNQISVKTLDLNLPFSSIAAQLDKIAENHFGVRI